MARRIAPAYGVWLYAKGQEFLLDWCPYEPAKKVKDIEGFVKLVDEDKNHCFLG
jgi:hypothetical protein